jgi:uncharacterized protein YbjQ (UPF0145 family)
MTDYFDLIVNFGIPLLVLIAAYFIGNAIEKKHYKEIRAREEKMHGFPVITFATLPSDWRVGSAELVTGSVVVSLDYFKRIIAGLRGIIGGRVKTYEPLLDRARREAVLRMIEDAKARGYDAVVNVRLETSRLASARKDGQGTAGVEMLAFGTAVTLT